MEKEMEMEMPMASLHKNSSSSSTVRFLGLLKQPDSDSVPFELDESEVVWSAELSDSHESVSLGPIHSAASTILSASPPDHRYHQYRPERFGLSAALSDDRRPLVQRKPSLNPSLSAASAARTIPPVPIPRSGGSEDFSNSSSGRTKFHQSAPVNVPVWPRGLVNGGPGSSNLGSFNEDDEDTEEEMLPPHEIVARSHTTTFSMFEGVGRTLKGRDLRRVRNAVFQKTGFLD
ncbi:uncharacterized protein LOC122082868 [Macadamia integrifolia]|uniref:uncharacterized protein LOC122082868 n=1 Tax=Macadamia integrifolia TaxID=60698 RepID=UPI001C4E5984|nr:uncharacterized protein LOC122082868 [Macadamia integrifolia]